MTETVYLEDVGEYHITNAERDAQETTELRIAFMLNAIDTRLSETQAQVLKLRYFSEPPKTRNEVADYLGCSRGNVDYHERTALQSLVKILRARANIDPLDFTSAPQIKSALAHHFPTIRHEPSDAEVQHHQSTRQYLLAVRRMERVAAYNASNGETPIPQIK